ncbi:MAG TPA: assimilatory sulfite reductase (NADPH) hemoprotein subunit [Metalysinibacillus jejuensis]|uniref:Sulfite reductase [NADPH] hemoprotein beta-component n=1 Tax=Metalysinibacillus jejuensis TaxID=914327 RepID=A0A921N9H2_9BACL|nr:assimilatory sulfite reductase (NADPH) hemoprotein subunit [Metalysinibacillus jejuensis]HJH10391.1 assimilatory sulfite reductase (NADPH) hemoprotein subunit [Metalysinibacillus jejuensis]
MEKIILPTQPGTPSDVEDIKQESNYLRGTLEKTMQNPLSSGIPEADNRLMKFHGSYLQDDRDLRNERQRQKLEPAYQFMVRVRTPGGTATPEQWLVMDEMGDKYGNGSLKLTTRQAFQVHGILKWNVKKYMQEIHEVLLDCIAACGDVNRNVMCNVNPNQSDFHQEVYEWSAKLSEHLLPKTRAYHELWLDGEKVFDGQQTEEVEPIYGALYLPRKFKIGIAIPPSNDVDVFSQDIGLIAVIENNELIGFNVAVGGGMGMTHGDTATYPQLGRLIGFIYKEQLLETAEKILTIQRDYGNRSVRKNARFKYTIDARGLEWFKDELAKRLSFTLEKSRPYLFTRTGDEYGWIQGEDGNWHHTLFIQNGRIKDEDDYLLKTGLREIAKVHTGLFRLTPNQNLLIADVTPAKKEQIDQLLKHYAITDGAQYSALRRNAIACVSLPTCGLAMAEAERYLPSLITKIDEILAEHNLSQTEIGIRMSGCPNGCSRAAMGEIGFIGKGPGKYNLYLGGDFTGQRLNKLYKENIDEAEILATLQPLLAHYAKERQKDEHFGDFVIRQGYVEAVTDGQHFHH